MDKKPIEVHMERWLTREEVESLPISKIGDHYTPNAMITERTLISSIQQTNLDGMCEFERTKDQILKQTGA